MKMVDFKGLDDVVANLEKEVTAITAELEAVKQQIERVKTEYHEEANPCKKGMREFLLEKAEKLDKNIWKPAEAAQEEIANMRDVMKRKVSEKEVVFVCTFVFMDLFFCLDKLVYIPTIDIKKSENTNAYKYSGKIGEAISIKYSEITDIDPKEDESINISSGIGGIGILAAAFSNFDTPGLAEIKIMTSDSKKNVVSIYDSKNVYEYKKSIITLFWDIYEFING